VLLVWAMGGQETLVWAQGSGVLSMTCSTGSKNGQWWLSRPEGGVACHHGGPVGELHLRPQPPPGLAKKKKKGGTATEHTLCCSHSPGNTPTLPLLLPNTPGSAHMLDHCHFPGH